MIIRFILPIIIFLLLILEGIAIDLLPSFITTYDLFVVPHWVFIFLLLMNLFYDTNDTYHSIAYGVIFGLLVDIVYTDLLGVYMFVYPFALYINHWLKRILHTNFVMSVVMLVIGISIVEFSIYFIYFLIGIVNSSFTFFLLKRLLPTLIANILFIIPLYVLFMKRLDRWGRIRFETLK